MNDGGFLCRGLYPDTYHCQPVRTAESTGLLTGPAGNGWITNVYDTAKDLAQPVMGSEG